MNKSIGPSYQIDPKHSIKLKEGLAMKVKDEEFNPFFLEQNLVQKKGYRGFHIIILFLLIWGKRKR